jgi:hypothetical protein
MIRPYGKVLEFQLSTRERTVFASFRLKGELEAIQFWIHQYQLVADKKGQTFRARFSGNGGRGRHCGEQALPGNGSGANCVSVSGSCEVRVAALAFAKKGMLRSKAPLLWRRYLTSRLSPPPSFSIHQR